MIDLVKNYSIMARRMKKSVIRELLKLTQKPEIISFAGGLPDPEAFPIDWVEEIIHTVIQDHGKQALQYSTTEGEKILTDELIKLARANGEDVTSENLLVTVASQQGLDLIGRVFLDPSDPIIVELPSYLGGLQAFKTYGAQMIGVPVDDDGIRTDLLEETLHQLMLEEEHYKFIYLVPDFQNPSGVTLSAARRKDVIRLSKKFDVLIIEDSPYRELRFEGEAPPTLYSMDDTNNVVCLHTFSKIFVPGLRLGWIKAHPHIIQKLTIAKQALDLCTPALSQFIAAEFCRRGYIWKHIENVRAIYHKKRDLMLKSLDLYMPDVPGLRWTKPQGGLFLWLILPESVDAEKLFPVAVENNVAYVIGSAFHCDGSGKNTMRLNFSFSSEEQIDEGVKRLAKVIKAALAGGTVKGVSTESGQETEQ